MPGTRIVNLLQDLKYRTQTLSDPSKLVETAEQQKPLLVLADLEAGGQTAASSAIDRLRQNPATKHLPVIAYGAEKAQEVQNAAKGAGALVVSDSAILTHLPQFLEQALQLE
jgi:CheY-like chemotaxis protein